MTMPHLENCHHSESGWCLDCVKALHDEVERTKERLKQTPEEAIAAERIRQLQDSDLFTTAEDGDKRSLGTRGVGVTWNVWMSLKVVVRAYLREHAEAAITKATS